ncbi:uncharacterized protein LOC144639015 [Oculina patagonica]
MSVVIHSDTRTQTCPGENRRTAATKADNNKRNGGTCSSWFRGFRNLEKKPQLSKGFRRLFKLCRAKQLSVEALLACVAGWLGCENVSYQLRRQRSHCYNRTCRQVHLWGVHTSISWTDSSSCEYRYDSAAFLFSLVNKPGWQPLKLDQTGEYSYWRYSIYSCFTSGPTFGGGWDIHIADHASINASSDAMLGYTYGPPTGYSFWSSFARTFLGGSKYFQPDEVEVFYETT